MARALAVWLTLAALAGPSPLGAQRRERVAASPGPSPQSCHAPDEQPCGVARTWMQSAVAGTEGAPASVWSIVASAILPGSGQAMLTVNRALPYLAVEAFAWSQYVRHGISYRDRRDGYRDLAARVARSPFSSLRPNGDFEYYEHMTHYLEAGRYDLIAGGAIEPETDSTTFNGAVWLLARRTYWEDPSEPPAPESAAWERAVAFYRARAYDQLFRWSWTGAPDQYAAFRSLIRQSNDANRLAMQDLGVIIANHVLSTVDAYITVRLRRRPDSDGFAVVGSIPLHRLRPAN